MAETHKKQEAGDRKNAADDNVLVDSTLDVVAHTLCSSRCSFMLIDRAADELRVQGARGLSPEVIASARAKIGESIAGIVARSQEPLLIRDLDAHPELLARRIGGCRTNSVLSVPVTVNGEVYGVLNVTDKVEGGPFEEHDLVTLNLLASHLGLCIETSLLHAEIQRLAKTDGLTGTFNHRYFHERLGEELERAGRFTKFISLLMIDVNGFKEFNDHYGHPAGDIALKEIAAALRECVRSIDVISRYGGDEFTVILPETDHRGALRVAARIARSLETRRPSQISNEGFDTLSLSIGISTYPAPARCKQDLIYQADRAMYIAKRRGPLHLHHWEMPKPAEDRPLSPAV